MRQRHATDELTWNRPSEYCVEDGMANYTDDELALMHTEGIDCPDDDRARAMYAALDQVDALLRQLRDDPGSAP